MENTSKHPLSGILAAASIFTGAGAVFAASCCVLPLMLGGLGAGAGLFSILEVLVAYRTAILVLSAALLALAWAVYLRRRGTRRTALALSIATVFVGTATGWDRLEPPLLKMIRAHR
jgi:mercuric ion transport protein